MPKKQKAVPIQVGYANTSDKESVNIVSAFGEKFPVVDACCFYIPLRLGSFIIAGLGILPTIACMVLSMPVGMKLLHEHGLPKSYFRGLGWIYGILSVFVFSLHIILCVALALRKRLLIILYLWSMFAYIAGSFGTAVVISVVTIKSGHTNFGTMFILLAIIHEIILIYFWVVINSQLQIVKEESNVVNIHITII